MVWEAEKKREVNGGIWRLGHILILNLSVLTVKLTKKLAEISVHALTNHRWMFFKILNLIVQLFLYINEFSFFFFLM